MVHFEQKAANLDQAPSKFKNSIQMVLEYAHFAKQSSAKTQCSKPETSTHTHRCQEKSSENSEKALESTPGCLNLPCKIP